MPVFDQGNHRIHRVGDTREHSHKIYTTEKLRAMMVDMKPEDRVYVLNNSGYCPKCGIRVECLCCCEMDE